MASIEINFNIMSHHGNADREAESSPQVPEDEGRRENDFNYVPRNLFPMHQAVRSEISMSATDPQSAGALFDITGFARFGGSDIATRNAEHEQRIPANHSNAAGYSFENQNFPALASRPPPPSTLFNEGGSFDTIEHLTEDLGRYPLIDVNEPTPTFPTAQGFDANDESMAFGRHMPGEANTGDGTASAVVPNRYEKQHIYSMFAHGPCAPQTNYEDDRKPAAIDPTPLRNPQQQYYNPNQQQFIYPMQAPNRLAAFDPNLNQQSSQDRIQEEKEIGERKPPPFASLECKRDRSTHETAEAREGLKSPPEASLPEQHKRRSRRLTARTTSRNIDSPKHELYRVAKPAGPKTRTRSKTKRNAKHKLCSTISFRPSTKQLTEARTQRKADALQTWFKRFAELVNFIDQNGHANVPQQFVENHSLGIWVNKQRMEKKAKDEGKSSSLTDEKIEMLEKVGFIWAKRKGQKAWEEKFRELQEYKLKHGNCNVPTKNKLNRALGRWVSTQRSNYKRLKQGNPPKQRRTDWEEAKRRIRRLNGIGFAWSLLPAGNMSTEEDRGSEEDQESSSSSSSNKETDSSSPPSRTRKRIEQNDGNKKTRTRGGKKK